MELVLLLVLLGVFFIFLFALKMPTGVSMFAGGAAALLVGGFGLPLRQLFEGSFAFLDTIMIIAMAMVFMEVVSETGALQGINAFIVKTFYKMPALMLILLMLIVMVPGMITGSSTASVLTTGSLVVPILLAMGMPKETAAAFIAVGGVLGLVAPPINLPVMIIGGGIDMPYSGFGLPLLALSMPIAIFSALFFGLKYAKNLNIDEVKKTIDLETKYSLKVYLPLLVVVGLITVNSALPGVIPNLGMPLIFMIGSLVGWIVSPNKHFIKTSEQAVGSTVPVMGTLMGVGTMIQVMTYTGIRGFIVNNVLKLPTVGRYLAVGLILPIFGGISAFASTSVIGVPFMFAELGKNQIVTAAGISMLAAIGDLLPPVALAGTFAAKELGIEKYSTVLKKLVVPILVMLAMGMLFIVFANPIAKILV